ncbi:acyl carrier protein [Streptomyces sp. NPDC006284]|jgi:acyl carrier protein|uniref:acyl carrier protein n=1 Tax=unclassified Streptomyces TaxID=2593676 RepID=UPI0033BD4C10
MSSPTVEKTDAAPSPLELTAWLTERIATHLEMPAEDIRTDEPLGAYGLDSIYALTVVAEIEDHLGVTLEPTVMWDEPTVAGLVDLILAELPLAA